MPSTFTQLQNAVYDMMGDPDGLSQTTSNVLSAITRTGSAIARELTMIEEEHDLTITANTESVALTLVANGGDWYGQPFAIRGVWAQLSTNTWIELEPATDRFRPENILYGVPAQYYLVGWDPTAGEGSPAEGCPVLHTIPGASANMTLRIRASVLYPQDTGSYDPGLPTGVELYHVMRSADLIRMKESDASGDRLLEAIMDQERKLARTCQTAVFS